MFRVLGGERDGELLNEDLVDLVRGGDVEGFLSFEGDVEGGLSFDVEDTLDGFRSPLVGEDFDGVFPKMRVT